MSSVGVFRKVDLDEKPYLVYTLAQTDDPDVSTSFLCPTTRLREIKALTSYLFWHPGIKEYLSKSYPVSSSPHFPNGRTGDQLLLDSDAKEICKLPLVPICNASERFKCGACLENDRSESSYACLECGKEFHKECVESPIEIRHPSHPFHSLLLTYSGSYEFCDCRELYIKDRCDTWGTLLYRCTTCELSMHPVCAMRAIPFVADHPKSHPHPLTFFPTQASLVCHICGEINKFDPTYVCVQCVFVIHTGCIGFPHVIRISRHHHRISFTPSLPQEKLSCRVCHKVIENNYGAYSCGKCEDAYFVHKKCALNPKVWDQEDLDGVPEEDDMIDDGEPFQRVADGIILHPFHCHNLRLEIIKGYDENKFCRGCTLPIYEGQFYSCLDMECDFILHEQCANAPRMKRHPLHPYPLTLKVSTIKSGNEKGKFKCTVCYRQGTGFFYESSKSRFTLDLRCASVTEPFEYQGHNHPLYLPLDPEEKSRCQTCDFESKEWKLRCFECDYVICFRCATFPYKVRYKHDDHFLTICDGKKASDEVEWCGICEGRIEEVKERAKSKDRKKELRFYRCDEYCTAFHVECLLGVDMNMKPHGNTIEDYIYFVHYGEVPVYIKVWIILNNSLSRPTCAGCNCRCRFPIFFKESKNKAFCSWGCMDGYATW